MQIVIDIEANSLVKPTKVWVICCKDTETGEYYVFREPSDNPEEAKRFLEFSKGVTLWIGHNWLEYDYPVLHDLLQLEIQDVPSVSYDTLLLSRLINFSRDTGHSIESYGTEFGLEKIQFNDFKKYSKEMELYCLRDVDIAHKVYLKYLKYISNPLHKGSILMEHKFTYKVINSLSNNGFKVNVSKAEDLLKEVTSVLLTLDQEIAKAFPPRLKLVREITPKVTKHGTLHKADFRWLAKTDGTVDLSDFNGGPFCRCVWEPFNPGSPKQVVDVLNTAGWKPTDKTDTHIECERALKRRDCPNRKELEEKLEKFRKTGWKVNETNLATLPDDAPDPARSLAKRILYESRRKSLTELLGLVGEDGRIHGKFLGIGAWTHRMAHQRPNTANIPNEYYEDGRVKLLGKELRQLWCAPRNRLLVGCDADSIQLRIFAHYVNDPELINAIVNGKKSSKTDPHSHNQRILGSVCKSRQAAKRFLYALFLGAGLEKLAQILGCSLSEAQEALDRLLEQYTGWSRLKREDIPRDAKRGWFEGLDGRKVALPGNTTGERRHLAMSGYLQNGEAVCMKMATLKWMKELEDGEERLRLCKNSRIILPEREVPPASTKSIKLVNLVHDEWQTETPNNMELAVWVAETQSRALREVGEELGLRCPLAGSYYNDDHKDYTIGTNWYSTH